jgi:hypothetical protein
MTHNPLQDDLAVLRRLVDFAEGCVTAFPAVLESGERFVAIGSSSAKQFAAMTAEQIEALRLELRDVFRRVAAGRTLTLPSFRSVLDLVRDPLPAGRRPRSREPRTLSVIVNSPPRDAMLYVAQLVLTTVAVKRLSLCAAADCGKAFIKVTKKRFCSMRCQSRTYMRTLREQDRAAKAAVMRKGRQDGRTTRAR